MPGLYDVLAQKGLDADLRPRVHVAQVVLKLLALAGANDVRHIQDHLPKLRLDVVNFDRTFYFNHRLRSILILVGLDLERLLRQLLVLRELVGLLFLKARAVLQLLFVFQLFGRVLNRQPLQRVLPRNPPRGVKAQQPLYDSLNLYRKPLVLDECIYKVLDESVVLPLRVHRSVHKRLLGHARGPQQYPPD